MVYNASSNINNNEIIEISENITTNTINVVKSN